MRAVVGPVVDEGVNSFVEKSFRVSGSPIRRREERRALIADHQSHKRRDNANYGREHLRESPQNRPAL